MLSIEIEKILKRNGISESKAKEIAEELEDVFNQSFETINPVVQKVCKTCKGFQPWAGTNTGFCNKKNLAKFEKESCKMWEKVTRDDIFTCRVCCHYRRNGVRSGYCSKHNKIKYETSKCTDFEHPF